MGTRHHQNRQLRTQGWLSYEQQTRSENYRSSYFKRRIKASEKNSKRINFIILLFLPLKNFPESSSGASTFTETSNDSTKL